MLRVSALGSLAKRVAVRWQNSVARLFAIELALFTFVLPGPYRSSRSLHFLAALPFGIMPLPERVRQAIHGLLLPQMFDGQGAERQSLSLSGVKVTAFSVYAGSACVLLHAFDGQGTQHAGSFNDLRTHEYVVICRPAEDEYNDCKLCALPVQLVRPCSRREALVGALQRPTSRRVSALCMSRSCPDLAWSDHLRHKPCSTLYNRHAPHSRATHSLPAQLPHASGKASRLASSISSMQAGVHVCRAQHSGLKSMSHWAAKAHLPPTTSRQP